MNTPRRPNLRSSSRQPASPKKHNTWSSTKTDTRARKGKRVETAARMAVRGSKAHTTARTHTPAPTEGGSITTPIRPLATSRNANLVNASPAKGLLPAQVNDPPPPLSPAINGLLAHVAQNRDYFCYSQLLSDIASMGGMMNSDILDSAAFSLASLPAPVGTFTWLLVMLGSARPTLDKQELAALLYQSGSFTKFVMKSDGEVEYDGLEAMEDGSEYVYAYHAEEDVVNGNRARLDVIKFIEVQRKKLVYTI